MKQRIVLWCVVLAGGMLLSPCSAYGAGRLRFGLVPTVQGQSSDSSGGTSASTTSSADRQDRQAYELGRSFGPLCGCLICIGVPAVGISILVWFLRRSKQPPREPLD